MEGRIDLAVPTAVQAVPVGLAGGRRYRSYSAQRGESSLGVSRSGLLPAVTSKATAVSDPIPKMLTRVGDAFGVRHAGVDRAPVYGVSGAAVWSGAPSMTLS